MATADKLQLTLNTKQAIKSALIAKGAEPADVFSTYPALIESLATTGIATPQIIAPMNGAVQVSQQPIITGTLYFSADPDDPHAASTWEFASDSGFANILHTSGRDTVNLESYDLSAAGYKLPGDTIVYVRLTYESQSGIEQTSPVTSFQITDMYLGAVIDGDIVFSQLGGYWLLAAPATKRAQRKWGLYGTDTSLPNNPSPDPNDGVYNTDVLTSSTYNSVNDGQGSTGAPAADYCRSLGEDYFLPNQEELNEVFLNKDVIDEADTSGGANTLASFGTTYVWSSTEHSSALARIQSFSVGGQGGAYKHDEYWVVPLWKIAV